MVTVYRRAIIWLKYLLPRHAQCHCALYRIAGHYWPSG